MKKFEPPFGTSPEDQVRRIVYDMGGPKVCADICSISVASVYRWVHRGNIPKRHLKAIEKHLQELAKGPDPHEGLTTAPIVQIAEAIRADLEKRGVKVRGLYINVDFNELSPESGISPTIEITIH